MSAIRLTLIGLFIAGFAAHAQENVAPIPYRAAEPAQSTRSKYTALEPLESASWGTQPQSLTALKEFLYNVIAERDRQYGQRFDAQEKAVAAALAATEKATAAAFAAQEKATAAAFAAAKEAVDKAQIASEKRFDNMNEFRGQLKDQQNLFVFKTENDIRFRSVTEKLDAVVLAFAQMQSRGEGAFTLWGFIAGAIGLILGVALAIGAFVHRSKGEQR